VNPPSQARARGRPRRRGRGIAAELALKLKPLIAEKAKDRQRKGGKEKVVQNSAQAPKTREDLAEIAGVSHDTIDKVETILEEATEKDLGELRRGEASINTLEQRAELALKLKPLIAEKAAKRMKAGKADPVHNCAQGKARDELAESLLQLKNVKDLTDLALRRLR
jgi:DNA-binding XRE family transcriptional regulator